MKRITMFLGAGILFLCSMVYAAVPQLINFQGQLKDGSGNPVPNASYSVAVRIYDVPSGPGLALWSDTFSVNTTGGLFNVVLGSEQPLPAALFSSSNLWVGLQVGGDPEATPRTQLTSVPYSARVGTVDGATGGVISGDVSIQSNLSVDGGMSAKGMALGSTNPGPPQVTPFVIQGAPGQSANLMEIKDALGVPLVNFGPNSSLFKHYAVFGHNVQCDESLKVNGVMEGKNLVLKQPGPSSTPLSIEGSPGQIAPLMMIKNSSGTTLVSCASDGIIATPAIQLTNFSTISNLPNPDPIKIETDKGSIFIGGSDGVLYKVNAAAGAPVSKLQEWRNGAGTPVASIDPAGNMALGGDMDGLNSTWENVQAIDMNCDGMLTANGGVTVGSGGPILQATGGAGGSGQLGAGGGGGGGVIKVQSPTDGANVLFEPGPGGNVGIGVAIPHSPLQVNGAIATAVTFVPGCASTTLDETHSVVLVAAAFGECFLNLPTAVGIQGRQYTIKAVPTFSGSYNIIPFAGQTIDGNASYILTAVNKYVTIVSDGTNWQIIGNN